MYRVVHFLAVLMLLGCSGGDLSMDKSELLGTWVSNAPLTIQESPSAIPEPFKSSLGKMAYVFTADKTTFTPSGSEFDQPNWHNWRVVESNQEYVAVEISGFFPKPEIVRFSKQHGCLGHHPQGQDFTEYFCKKEG